MGLEASCFLASSSFFLIMNRGSSLTLTARSVALLAASGAENSAPGPVASACHQKNTVTHPLHVPHPLSSSPPSPSPHWLAVGQSACQFSFPAGTPPGPRGLLARHTSSPLGHLFSFSESDTQCNFACTSTQLLAGSLHHPSLHCHALDLLPRSLLPQLLL